LVKALEVGNSVYSLHNHPQNDKQLIKLLKASKSFVQISPSPFLKKYVEQNNGMVKAVYAMLMTIPHMFDFHTKIKHDFVVDLYVLERKSS
jgi:predicted RNA methylase